MYVWFLILIGLCAILFFLYVSLKRDVHQLRKQLAYDNQEESRFSIFTTSFDKDMQELRKNITDFRTYYQKESIRYMQMDQNFKKMITNISHDIRTPLTGISGYIQLLEETKDPIKQQQYYEIIYKRLRYLNELLEELFLYTKLTNDALEMHLTPVSLYDMVCDSILSFHEELQTKKIEVYVDFTDPQTKIYADEICTRRMLANLMVNVLRHGTSYLRIEQRIEHREFVLSYVNEVEADVQIEVLFERFYTADKVKNRSSGLGLAIVKEIIEQMGGRVEAQLIEHQLHIIIHFPVV